ncbi:MAG TPA: type II secretion system F family protein [Candidatus Paceibacterota bacterium]|nr:type II secretion system F family protein [Candidatus Paceibacterota bacterium]
MEYTYQAKGQDDHIFNGSIEAPSQDAAVSILQGKSLVVLSLVPVKQGLLNADIDAFLSRPNSKDIVSFTRQLSTLIEADVPLAEGLHTLGQQVEKVGFKKILAEIGSAVEGGSSLSQALAAYPKLFSSFYIKLVQAGELSGKLESSLTYLADYMERSQGITSKIKGALAYPAFVVAALIGVTAIMVIYVLPQLLSVIKDSGVKDLPISTVILVAVTNFINGYLYWIIGALILFIVFAYRTLKTPDGRAWLDNLMIKVPTLGVVVRNLYLARMAESLSTLIKSGISILEALQITADLVGNTNYRNIMHEAEDNVRNGGAISEVLAKYPEVPPMFTSMVSIGERTGKLDYMLEHVSKFYKSESDNAIGSITQLLEPILVLILGVGVALVVSGILLPIYSLVGATQ